VEGSKINARNCSRLATFTQHDNCKPGEILMTAVKPCTCFALYNRPVASLYIAFLLCWRKFAHRKTSIHASQPGDNYSSF